jgi:hypothetical protein
MSRIRHNPGILLLISFIVPLILSAEVSGEDQGDKLGEIIKVWRKRQTGVQLMDFIASGKQHKPEVKLGTRASKMLGQPTNSTVTIPAIAFDVEMRLAVDTKGRTRFDFEGKTWSSKEHAYVEQSTSEVFDVKERTLLFKTGNLDFPNAHINRVASSETFRDLRVLAILIAFCPFDSRLGLFRPAALEVTNKQGVLGGRRCIILKHSENQSAVGGTVWVDPARSYVPVRYFESQRGKVVFSVDIEYSPDTDVGWVPTAWNNSLFTPDGRQLAESLTVKVKKYEINHGLVGDPFRLVLSPGTWVSNNVTGERYILRDGSVRRPVQKGEFTGSNFQELLHTDPPGGGSYRQFVFLLFIVGMALVLLGTTVFVYRRIRGRDV